MLKVLRTVVCKARVTLAAMSSPTEGLKEGVIHRNCKTQSPLAPFPVCPRLIITRVFNHAHVEELAICGSKVSVTLWDPGKFHIE